MLTKTEIFVLFYLFFQICNIFLFLFFVISILLLFFLYFFIILFISDMLDCLFVFNPILMTTCSFFFRIYFIIIIKSSLPVCQKHALISVSKSIVIIIIFVSIAFSLEQFYLFIANIIF